MNDSFSKPTLSRKGFLGVLFFGAAALWGISGCDNPEAEDQLRASEAVSKLLGGGDNLDLIEASKVKAYVLDPTKPLSKNPKRPGEMRIGGYAVIGGGEKEKDASFAKKMANDVLFKDATYTAKKQKTKCFNPEVGFRMEKAKSAVEILVCFKCQKIKVIFKEKGKGDKEQVVHTAIAPGNPPEFTGSFDDATYTKLYALAKDPLSGVSEFKRVSPKPGVAPKPGAPPAKGESKATK